MIVSGNVQGMRLFWAIVKALLPPRPPGYDVLCINKRGRSAWRRAIVAEASPLADPSLVQDIASVLMMCGEGIPNPIIQAAHDVYSQWTHWFAGMKQLLDDYIKTDVARVMRDSCIEEFYHKYKLSDKITPTHLIQGRMRGVIRRKIQANPFKGEGVMIAAQFELKPTNKKSIHVSRQIKSRNEAMATMLPSIMRRYQLEDAASLDDIRKYVKHVGARYHLDRQSIKEMPELLHLWYLAAKHSSGYLRRVNEMVLYKPEVPMLSADS